MKPGDQVTVQGTIQEINAETAIVQTRGGNFAAPLEALEAVRVPIKIPHDPDCQGRHRDAAAET